MIKRRELSSKASCFNRAHDDELMFVLLARDAASPVAIRAWIAERIRLGKNFPDDPQITEAARCAEMMSGATAPLAESRIHFPAPEGLKAEGLTVEVLGEGVTG